MENPGQFCVKININGAAYGAGRACPLFWLGYFGLKTNLVSAIHCSRYEAASMFRIAQNNGHSADTSKSPAGGSQAGLCISF